MTSSLLQGNSCRAKIDDPPHLPPPPRTTPPQPPPSALPLWQPWSSVMTHFKGMWSVLRICAMHVATNFARANVYACAEAQGGDLYCNCDSIPFMAAVAHPLYPCAPVWLQDLVKPVWYPMVGKPIQGALQGCVCMCRSLRRLTCSMCMCRSCRRLTCTVDVGHVLHGPSQQCAALVTKYSASEVD